ncbi:unnamed protein product [Urochloa humidicola]
MDHERLIQRPLLTSPSSSLESKKRSHYAHRSAAMASPTALTIILCFAAAFFCLQHLEAAAKIKTSQGGLARVAASALLPSVLITFGLTLLLLVTHVRELSRMNAAAAGLNRLAKATLAATAAALIAGAVMGFVAD